MRLERTIFRHCRCERLRITQNFRDPDGMILPAVFEVDNLPAAQEVSLKSAVQLFVVSRRQADQERDIQGIQRFRDGVVFQLFGDRKKRQDKESVVHRLVPAIRDPAFRERVVLVLPYQVIRPEPGRPLRHHKTGSKDVMGRLDRLVPMIDCNNHY